MTDLKPVKEGKVRELYDNGASLIMVATDRISAFDVILKNKVEGKGIILTKMSKFWFDFTENIIPNHMVSTDVRDMPEKFQSPSFEGRSMLCKKLHMLPVECIVRGYITGSGWKSYLKDGNISFEKSAGVLEKEYPGKGKEYAEILRDKTIALYKACAEYALTRGIIIADTKFEFGIDEEGRVVLADEMLTPDSSRFWPLKGYEPGHGQPSFDKQFVRDYLTAHPDCDYQLPQEVIDKTVGKYQEAYDLLVNGQAQTV